MNGNGQQEQIEIPADVVCNYLAQRIGQLTVELEMARATIAYLTSAPVAPPVPSEP